MKDLKKPVGDGLTDDTEAIQAIFNKGIKWKT